jgi:hypothetical protein
MNKTHPGRLAVLTATVTAVTGLSALAGVVGLVGGGISFGEAIDARLPFGSLPLAGLALLVFVAVPQGVATMATARRSRWSPTLVFAAGALLVAWIAIELAFIKFYSWFHPTYLAVAVVIVVLGWLLQLRGSGTHGPRPTEERVLEASSSSAGSLNGSGE